MDQPDNILDQTFITLIMKIESINSTLRLISILTLILLPLFHCEGFALETSLESKIQAADSLWKNNRLTDAIVQYKLILDKEVVPTQYQSLIYLRLANAQFQAKLFKDCRRTVIRTRSLPVLPAHHLLMIGELEKKLDHTPLLVRTPVPAPTKVAASLYVSAAAGADSKGALGKVVFQTLKQALDALPALRKRSDLPEGSIEIILEDVSFQLNETIQLNSDYSGSRKNPLVIRSASADHNVVFNGGKQIKFWDRETNPTVLSRLPETSRSGIWVADLKKNDVCGIDSLVFGGFSSKRAAGGNATFNTMPVPELFDNSLPQQMARWPNEKDTIIALKDFKSGRALKWAADQDVWLHGYWFHMWADAYEKMGGVSPKDATIEIVSPANNYGFGKSKWHVVNALSELDTPGEWCLSVKEGKIWYYPKNDIIPDQTILSTRGPALTAENCNYLTLKGIEFQYIRGDGMIFTNCSHLTLTNCSVKYTSGLGINIDGGSNHLVHTCAIESMGRGGIAISAGDKLTLVNSGSIIENCRISNLSRIDRTYTPAIVLAGDGIKLRHCLFAAIPSSGIRLEGNDMLVELNEFTKCVSESDDQGAIDVWGNPLYRGNVIRWNFFHDIGVPNLHMAAGVRLDDAISGFGIYENLFLRSSSNMFGGIQIHGGKDNFLEGNIFVDCHAAFSQSAWGEKRWLESINNPEHPMYKAMHTTNWQSELWLRKYPALKQLLTGADINYATDNIIINATSLVLRKSKPFELMNNRLVKSENHPATATDYKEYLVPWHPVPVDLIGLYK